MTSGLFQRTYVRLATVMLVVTTLVSSSSTSIATTASVASTVPVPGHVSAHTAKATMVSRLPADRVLGLTIALRPRSDHALADAVALSKSEAAKRLTVAELGASIGQPAVNITTITSYFRNGGLTVEPLAPDQLSFRVTGTVSDIQKALSVTLENYQDEAGRQFYSTDGDPTLPGDVASGVQAIYGLDNFPALNRMNQRVAGFAGAYVPSDMRTAYDVNPLYTAGYNGNGETIGILGCDNFLNSDIQSFEDDFSMPHASITRVTIDDGATSSDPEPTIDLEWSLAIAPNASIIYYGFSSGGSCSFQAMLDAMVRVVSDNTASVVSISLGACESDFQGSGFLSGLENEFQAASALGQSVFVSSGDNGAYTPCSTSSGSPMVSYPASSAFVTAVGGTSLTTHPNSSYAGETAWGSANGCSNGVGPIPCGSGEGVSQVVVEPPWQSAAPISLSGGHRGVADVSWNADPKTGYDLFITGGGCTGLCGGWGGTSIAAPQWAGLAALADQAAGKRFGLLGPILYGTSVLSMQTSTHCAPYHDVTQPSSPQALPNPLLYPAGPGWDLPTGWGSPDAYRLLESFIPGVPTGLTPSDSQTTGSSAPAARLGTTTGFRVALPLIFQVYGC